MNAPTVSERQPTHISEMMQRLGIEPGEGIVPRLSLSYATAFIADEFCPAKETCREWLDSIPQSVSAPRISARMPIFCLS